jgi:hypothetical protein
LVTKVVIVLGLRENRRTVKTHRDDTENSKETIPRVLSKRMKQERMPKRDIKTQAERTL